MNADSPSTTPDLASWIGRTETTEDTVTATPIAALAATLGEGCDRPRPGTAIPLLWHWLYFLPLTPRVDLGADGHARKGGFLPPISRPRRMWAGGQFAFHSPIRVGDAMRRVSTVVDILDKHGRSGVMTFVRVKHEIFCNGSAAAAVTEFHDIVYRDAAKPGEPAPLPKAAPQEAAWRRHIEPDDVLLFRYSALTFNGHRIHYDRRYVTEVEGYPGLVVHGPLIATLLMELPRRMLPDRKLATFEFRAVRPTFDLHPFSVQGTPSEDGRGVRLWAQDHEGFITMDASATFG